MKFFRKTKQLKFLEDVSLMFSHRVRTHGDTPAGVLWKNIEGQQLRFEVLAGILDDVTPYTPLNIIDYGCGYGAFFDFLLDLPQMPPITFTGYDISPEMITVAKKRRNDIRASFHIGTKIQEPGDYTFISGTFNLCIKATEEIWKPYIQNTLKEIWPMCRKGLAFNMLDINSPQHGEGLFYADANDFKEICLELSSDVTLVDNYPLDEWTMLVRR